MKKALRVISVPVMIDSSTGADLPSDSIGPFAAQDVLPAADSVFGEGSGERANGKDVRDILAQMGEVLSAHQGFRMADAFADHPHPAFSDFPGRLDHPLYMAAKLAPQFVQILEPVFITAG